MLLTGRFTSFEDHGTIVVAWFQSVDTLRRRPVCFDHRPFQHLLDAEGIDTLTTGPLTLDTDSGTVTVED